MAERAEGFIKHAACHPQKTIYHTQAALGYVAERAEGFVDLDSMPEEGADTKEVRIHTHGLPGDSKASLLMLAGQQHCWPGQALPLLLHKRPAYGLVGGHQHEPRT